MSQTTPGHLRNFDSARRHNRSNYQRNFVAYAAGAMLVFGGEISGFLKQLIYLVLAISLILCGNSFITNVMGHKTSTGATIAYVQVVDSTDSHTIVINS